MLKKSELMFPEGVGAPRAFVKDAGAVEKTNELLENATNAIKRLWEQRGYDPKKPDEIKSKLGYPLDKYEAVAYLVTGALSLPLLSPQEAGMVGKRINNVIGVSGTIGAKLKALRRRGKSTMPQCDALLQATATLNLQPPAHPPTPAPAAIRSPLPLPVPPCLAPVPPPAFVPHPPSVLLPAPATEFTHLPAIDYYEDYVAAGGTGPYWSEDVHPDIPGYRGLPGGDEAERFWNPAKPPCVPSDHRPVHLFNSREAAEAIGAASRVEQFSPWEGFDESCYDEEAHEIACIKHKHAMCRLVNSFPEIASQEHLRRPCPCGHGALAVWPWVVQAGQSGICECDMASMEFTCWRCEWIAAGWPNLAW